jgi:methionine synthase I (cobalamin-dependent)
MDLDDYLGIAEDLMACSHGLPVLLQPNAGTPISTPDGFKYATTPSDFASWSRQAADLGVTLIGGCCGTTPAHIEALAKSLATEKPCN